jgi:hypothetical protein
MPQAEWYNEPYFSVSPIGERKVAEIKYNNRFRLLYHRKVKDARENVGAYKTPAAFSWPLSASSPIFSFFYML